MAPVLTRLFTPLFTLVLLAFLATMAWTGSGIDSEAGSPHWLRPAFGAGPGIAALLRLGSRSRGAARSLRPAAIRAGGQRSGRRSSGSGGHRHPHLRVRIQPQPGGGAGREPDPAGQSGVVGLDLRPLPAGTRLVPRSGALADGVSSPSMRYGPVSWRSAFRRCSITPESSPPSIPGSRALVLPPAELVASDFGDGGHVQVLVPIQIGQDDHVGARPRRFQSVRRPM